VGAVRTPFGAFQGSLAPLSATHLGSLAIKGAAEALALVYLASEQQDNVLPQQGRQSISEGLLIACSFFGESWPAPFPCAGGHHGQCHKCWTGPGKGTHHCKPHKPMPSGILSLLCMLTHSNSSMAPCAHLGLICRACIALLENGTLLCMIA